MINDYMLNAHDAPVKTSFWKNECIEWWKTKDTSLDWNRRHEFQFSLSLTKKTIQPNLIAAFYMQHIDFTMVSFEFNLLTFLV